VIVMPGYAFGGTIVEAAPEYPDVKFIALDVAAGDLLEAGVGAVGESYDYNPANWDLNKYVDMSNVYCAVYQEELCGYMAGYAAVKLGYTKLGFLGGMAVPAVIRYGFGFVQGADAAAAKLGVKVDMNYSWLYGSSFQASNELQTMAAGWYTNGTEVIFACGGSMFQSIAAAASAEDCAVIGVDVDQSFESPTVITSAMKGIGEAAQQALKAAETEDSWKAFIGDGNTAITLGAAEGAVGLPTATWSLEGWSVADYEAMLADIVAGKVVVDNADVPEPASTANVTMNIVK
ncbi:MAG: BMP family ABC transporter substrate-binding protein, partial [Clostridiales bacterium]|nr:BMP family ABC transporter substrate-binding protein [Clostridiales bacterium]